MTSEEPPVDTPDRSGLALRRTGIAMLIAGGMIFLAGAWLGVTALMANSQLNQVRADARTLATQLAASNWPAARATAADLATHAHRANQLTSGPVWALAAALPSGGEPLTTVRGITAGADALGRDALPQLVSAAERLNPKTLRRPDGSIDVARVKAIAPAVASASAAVTRTTTSIDALPRHTWVSSIDTASAEALKQVTTLDATLKSANLAVRMVPTMLGADGPRRYLMAFQNEAEARGTGGLPGAYAIIEANHGKLKFAQIESDSVLSDTKANVNLGADYRALYAGAATTSMYVNANLSPNFPYAAQIWASMWKTHSGQKIDGVIAVDPTALGYLLEVTGPARLKDGSVVSGANAVALTQSTNYARFPGTSSTDNAERKAFLIDVAKASSETILSAKGEPSALLRAAGKAAGERRILVWSSDPVVQADLALTSVSGVIPTTTAPYVGLSIVNEGGNKLDYYLDRSLTWARTGCGARRASVATIKLTNNAPAGGLSTYVTGRSDRHGYPVKAGDNRLAVSYLATQGAQMDSVTVGGRPGTARVGVELGHPVFTMDVELPRGTSRIVVLHLTEPAGPGEPIVLRQPLVRPLTVKLLDTVCT